MSSYNGADLFGSGPHTITVGAVEVSKKHTAFAGGDGFETLIMGRRGRPVRIGGMLLAASAAALNALVDAIEDYVDDKNNDPPVGRYTLVDGAGVSWTNVELDQFRLRARFKVLEAATEKFACDYEISGRQVYA